MILDRISAVGRAYLGWLRSAAEKSQRTPPPLWNDFLDDSESVVLGEQVTEDGLRDVMVWLNAHGMIEGGGISEVGFPARVLLTSAGQICLMDYDGDVRAYARSRLGGIFDSVLNYGDHTQIANGSPGASQQMTAETVDVDALKAAVGAISEAVPALELAPDDLSAVERVMAAITTEVDGPALDRGVINAHVGRLEATLEKTPKVGLAALLAAALRSAVHRS